MRGAQGVGARMSTLKKRVPRRYWRHVQLVLFALVAAASVALAVQLLFRVDDRLEDLSTSRTDNVQWTIAQLEVEFLELQAQLGTARRTGAADLEELRQRFDIFYSRVETMMQSPVYSDLVPRDAPAFRSLSTAIDAMIPLMDGPDEALMQALPAIDARLSELRPILRRASAHGVTEAAARTQATRTEMHGLLVNLSLVMGLLLVSLASLAWLFWRQSRVNLARARVNRQISARLSTIIATSLDAIIVTDPDGRVIEMNEAAERMFGTTQGAVRGTALHDMVRPADDEGEAPPLLPPAQTAGQPARRQLVARHADGHSFDVEMTVGVPRHADGAIRACFLRDISQRLESEASLREARDRAQAGARAKAQFLAVMSHEMRTPLNGVLGALDLLKHTALDADQRHYAQILESSAQVLLGHVNDVLDVAQIEAGRIDLAPANFALDDLLAELVRDMTPAARRAGNRIILNRTPEPLGEIHADRHRLRQILTNLISNAVKFTRDGTITLDVSIPLARSEVVFELSDTGVGIAPERLNQIFDDFARIQTPGFDHVEGTGLGLGIVKRLAQAMNARVGVESLPGEGSMFRLRLPLSPLPAQVATAPATPPEHAPPMDILIVEDNAINRFVLRRQLEAEGHHVQEAEDGRAGIDAAMAARFDAILMDLSMPGMDGLQATREIRASGGPSSDVRIVVVTAHMIEIGDEACHAAGVDAIITKPVQRADLLHGLYGATDRPAPQPQDAPASILDTAVIDSLRTILSPDRVQDLLVRFRDEGDALLHERQVLEGLDAARAAHLAHRLAGGAATLGARALHQALEQAVARLAADESAVAAAALEDARQLWPETVAALDRAA
ncbi:MAG: response regulator [Sediminimonas qiaohouensis]|uniref:histidine kinase n=2 Tax=Sediminimonas qiaohouensis TaxID=552061 RepID=A0A7C9HM46_9RHOB|nr:response regulator [Sediminimonas qiaohouensis]